MTDNILPIEIIFNLLCVCRRLDGDSPRTLRRAMLRRGLYYGAFDDLPHLGFWIRLCQAAALLDENNPPCPTLFAPDWLALPWDKQYTILIEAWLKMPISPYRQRLRQRLLRHLLNDSDLNTRLCRELPGLQSLGFCEGNVLTLWGHRFLTGQLEECHNHPSRTWQISGNELHIPYPPDWHLLWDLEFYLMPIDPGIYPIAEKALRLAAQCGKQRNPDVFLQLLEQGLQSPLPAEIIACFEKQPTLKVLSGVVLEFSSPKELEFLRHTPSWRRDLNLILSPHHVLVDCWNEDRVLARLHRWGLLSGRDISSIGSQLSPAVSHLSLSERTYLLSIMLISDGLNSTIAAPPGLLGKLVEGLPMKLRAAAARKAHQALDDLLPAPAWVPEEELPPIPEPQLIDDLENAINKQLSVDILYQKAEQYQAEHRRITPLVIEQRGLRFYLIAYCHSRRANRTFRIDRLQLLDEPPRE